MSLAPGARLGAYEITALIGSGGMGEVYRARDTRLKRDVAIKILPDAFAFDSDRLARFQREAELLATLNHPHIAQIYDVEDRALVLELVEGPTLADRIAKGPIPLDEALPIARQIAEALEAAHERGIVHRDLKSGNVKMTPDGKVKVLDFGLAKAVADATGAETYVPAYGVDHLSASPTITSPALSMRGVILGTAAYMSPEQARGKPVDKRTDIWAFGCVLYEMLTGKRAFDGEDVSETLASIIKGDPDWSPLPSDTPDHVRHMLRFCLEKDRHVRIPDASAVRFLLQHPAPVRAHSENLRHVRRPWAGIAWKATALLSTAALLTVGAIYRPAGTSNRDVVRFAIQPPANTIFATARDEAASAVISPDGSALAFTARDRTGKLHLWVRPLDSLEAIQLKGTEDAELPFWSPDSRFIGFALDGRLQKISRDGGPTEVVSVIPSGGNGRGSTWSSSGHIVFNGGAQQLYRVPSSGGQPALLIPAAAELTDYSFPSFLPDGQHVLFFVQSRSAQRAGVYVTSLEGMEPKLIVNADTAAVFAPRSRRLLYARNGMLYAQPFDLDRLSVSGEPSMVADRIEMSAIPGLPLFSVSDNETLAYTSGTGLGSKAGLKLTLLDRAGRSVRTIGETGHYRGIDLSPDDTRLAAHLHDADGGDIWVTDVATGATRRLTYAPLQDNSSPVWSPDGQRIAFASLRNGKWGIYARPADGAVGETRFLESDAPIAPVSWSGGSIAYVMLDRTGGYDIWNFSLGDGRTVAVVQDEGSARTGQISPDGKWLAFRSDVSGRNQIHVTAFPTGGRAWQISPDIGSFPRWRSDGNELFFVTSTTGGDVVAVTWNPASTGFEASAPRVLFNPRYSSSQHTPGYHAFAVTRDGQRFFFPLREAQTDGDGDPQVVVVMNWSSQGDR